MRALRKQQFLRSGSRWKCAIRKVMREIRVARNVTQRSSRPEDIVNSSIQVFSQFFRSIEITLIFAIMPSDT